MNHVKVLVSDENYKLIANTDPNHRGIIIVLQYDNPIGYIVYKQGWWKFNRHLEYDNSIDYPQRFETTILRNLCSMLCEKLNGIRFEFIEFQPVITADDTSEVEFDDDEEVD